MLTFIKNWFMRPFTIPVNIVTHREKPTVEAVPIESFGGAWQAVLATGIDRRRLLLILDQYSFDKQICSCAGETLLNRYLSELSIHALEMIFRAGNDVIKTRAADAILLKAKSKDDLSQLIITQNVHQNTVAYRILGSNPNLTDIYRCMSVSCVAETAFALYQEHVLAGRVPKKDTDHFCTFNERFGERLLAWINSNGVAQRIPLSLQDNRDTGYQPSWFSQFNWHIIRRTLSCYELARCMDEPSVAKAAFAEYKARILAGDVSPEHIKGMCHPSRPFSGQLHEWLEQQGIQYDLSLEVKLIIWAMMKTSSPQFARVYVN
jgi:hypothetical protein